MTKLWLTSFFPNCILWKSNSHGIIEVYLQMLMNKGQNEHILHLYLKCLPIMFSIKMCKMETMLHFPQDLRHHSLLHSVNMSDLWIPPHWHLYTCAWDKCWPGETESWGLLEPKRCLLLPYFSFSEKAALKPVKTTAQVLGSYFMKL